jgi:hypothetical protein
VGGVGVGQWDEGWCWEICSAQGRRGACAASLRLLIAWICEGGGRDGDDGVGQGRGEGEGRERESFKSWGQFHLHN